MASNHDPNPIIQAAKEKAKQNDFEGGKMIFTSALLSWIDEAMESTGDTSTLREAVATLWISYANFLTTAKQFKSAKEAYEQAVKCDIGSSMSRVWLEYALFEEERNKRKSAQDIYMRALLGPRALQDEQDRSLLWDEFLVMMRKSNPSLTMEELQAAVRTEDVHQVKDEKAPDEVLSSESPRRKKIKLEPVQGLEDKEEVVTAASFQSEADAFLSILKSEAMDDDLKILWMARDGCDGPTQLPEPPLFEAKPPKLSDTTGKELLGVDDATSLLERLLSASGPVILEVCRALWSLQAVYEKKTASDMANLDDTLAEELRSLEDRMANKLSATNESSEVMKALNAKDKEDFHAKATRQRQDVVTDAAWKLRSVLATQQLVLTKLRIPGFNGKTIDAVTIQRQSRVCAYLHSAFYLRSRVKEGPHRKMLLGHLKTLKEAKVQSITTSAEGSQGQDTSHVPMYLPIQPPHGYQAQFQQPPPSHNYALPVLPPPPPQYQQQVQSNQHQFPFPHQGRRF